MPGNPLIMSPFERALAEIDWLGKHDSVSIGELMLAFRLSQATAKRDFKMLEHYGYIVRDTEDSERSEARPQPPDSQQEPNEVI